MSIELHLSLPPFPPPSATPEHTFVVRTRISPPSRRASRMEAAAELIGGLHEWLFLVLKRDYIKDHSLALQRLASSFAKQQPGRVKQGIQFKQPTGISSQIRSKLREWAIWQARAGCYTQAELYSNDSKYGIIRGHL